MHLQHLACFRHLNWNPNRRELRRFGWAMLVGFLLLGSLAAWRTQQIGWQAIMLWSIGLVLALSAHVPALGRMAYLAVYIPSSIIGFVISQVMLFLIFGFVFLPLALMLRIRGVDQLRLKRPPDRTYWIRLEASKSTHSYYHQF